MLQGDCSRTDGDDEVRTVPQTFRDERGQIMVLFSLVLFTLLTFAALVINVGQILTRKALAQKLADVGALAGATEQATSLNKIADINAKAFYFLRWTALVTRAYPFDYYKDADDVVDDFLESFGQLMVFDPLQTDVEDELTQAPLSANAQATSVTTQNIKDLFPNENVADFGMYNPDPNPQTFDGSTALFTPTSPHPRDVNWWYYTSRSCAWYDVPCWITFEYECVRSFLYLTGGLESHTFSTYRTREDPQREIHFYWQVTVPQTGSILGMMPKLPPVTAIAKAKPFGGQSGEPPEEEEIPNEYFAPFIVWDCTCEELGWPPLENNWYSSDYTYMVPDDFSSTFRAKLDAFTYESERDKDMIDQLKAEYGSLSEVIH